MAISASYIAGMIYGCWTLQQIFATKEVKDYCENEVFTAQCSYDEVVVMETAMYGRMRRDRCVKVDMGYIGCKSDVIDLADDKCSGHRSCEIRIPDTTFERTQPCLELKSYLEANYSCLKVLTVESSECRSAKFLRALPPRGRIASVTAQESWCGTRDTPWLIHAHPGTRINITLTDFHAPRQITAPGASKESDKELSIPVVIDTCHKYATVVEHLAGSGAVERSVVVCGRRTRGQQVFVSEGYEVQVLLETRRMNADYFILNYEVFGCANPILSENTIFKRVKNEATIECKLTGESWIITCVGNEWSGKFGNCTEYANYEIIGRSTSNEQSGKVSTFVVVGVCAVLITLLLILFGIIFYRRYRRRCSLRSQLGDPATGSRSSYGGGKGASKYSGEEELDYVHPSREHTYGRHHRHHRRGGHEGGGGEHSRHDPDCARAGAGMDGASTNYEKVGSFGKNPERFVHIWEMPLPIPGE